MPVFEANFCCLFRQLFIEKGKIIIYAQDKDSTNRLDTMFDGTATDFDDGSDSVLINFPLVSEKMNDGDWHTTSLNLARNHIELVVDGRPSITRRVFYMESGPTFMIGGNMPNYVGFLGCMRNIHVESNTIHPLLLAKSDLSSDIMVGACQMVDRFVGLILLISGRILSPTDIFNVFFLSEFLKLPNFRSYVILLVSNKFSRITHIFTSFG